MSVKALLLQRRELDDPLRRTAEWVFPDLANALRQDVEMASVEAQPLQRRELATALWQAVKLVSIEAQLLQRREPDDLANAHRKVVDRLGPEAPELQLL